MNPAAPPASARHAIDGTLRVFLAEALIFPTGLIIQSFLTRKFGPTGYGLFFIAFTIIAWIEWSLMAVFSRATIRAVADCEDWRPVARTTMRLHLICSTVAMLAVMLLASRIAKAMDKPALTLCLRIYALEIPLFSLAQAHRDVLMGIGKFHQRALGTVGRWIARLALVLLLVSLGMSIPGAILASVGACLVDLLICHYYLPIPLRHRDSFPISRLWEYA
ncbi:MAG TPA: oligosaccharide flippase family protein, partial [Tepidisphaeraceae bacterium]